MTTRISILFLLILIPFYSFSQVTEQDSLLQWWFPISIDETKEILEDRRVIDTKKWNFETAFSFPEKISEQEVFDEIPFGQYIKADAVGANVKMELKYHSNLIVELLDTGKKRWIIIVNEKGERIKVDKLIQGKKKLEYDEKYQAYPLNMARDAQDIIYEYKNLIGHFYLAKENERRYYGNIWYRFKRSKIGQVLVVRPKYFFKKIFTFRKKGNKYYTDDQIYNYHPSYNGYVALNQPKFSHFDTLKIKGYFIKSKKGKPYNSPINITIGGQVGYNKVDTVYHKELLPDSPGRFLLDFVIDDSLKLDKNYKIIFAFQHRKKQERWVKDFYVEDYELDDVKYEFSSVKKEYDKNDKIILKADAKYTTGKRVPNAQVKLKLSSGNINEYLADSLVIPDTLWTHMHELNFTDETQIVVPDSILPKARMKINAIAEFSTLDGEIQTKKTSFSINENSGKETEGELFLTYEKGYIKGEYKVKDNLVNTDVTLRQKTDKGSFVEVRQTPFKIKYNPFVRSYQIQKGYEIETIESYEIKDNPVIISGEKKKDSIFIQLNNKYELPIHYVLLYGNKILEQGISNDSIWIYDEKSKGKDNYYLSYAYVWAGIMKKESEYFHLNENQLNIQINQPKDAEPGDEIQVKIKVEDQKGKPVGNVELASAALSTKFKDDFTNAFETPSIKRQKSKSPKWKKEFRLEGAYVWNIHRRQEINEEWYDKLNLKFSSDYIFRFPKNGIHVEYVPLPVDKDTFPQFIPLITHKGEYRKPYSVDYNRQPIYYHDTKASSYVFVGDSGKYSHHDITLRLDTLEIKMNDVPLKNGYKLIISVEQDSILNGAFDDFSYTMKPNKWEKRELYERANSLMYVNRNNQKELYIWKDKKRVFYVNEKYRLNDSYLVGPFLKYDSLNYIYQYHFQRKLSFEPDFKYEIDENRERLYHYGFEEKNKKEIFKYSFFTPNISDFAITPKEVKYIPKNKINSSNPFAHLYNNRLLDYNAKTQLQIKYTGSHPVAWVAINMGNKDNYVFNPNVNTVQNLPIGKYKILYIFEYGYISKYIEIQNHHQSFLRINNTGKDLSTKDFKNTIKSAFGVDFDWENSIFKKSEERLLGMIELLEEKDFSDLVIKSKKQQTIYTGKTRNVSGIVMLEGEPAIGANVVVDGYEEIGTVTEFDGSFSLEVPVNSTNLKISYTGCNTALVNTDNLEVIATTLVANSEILEEAVVIGYSAQPKRALMASVVKVKSEMISSVVSVPLNNNNSFDKLLQGRAQGVQITSATGKPEFALHTKIRGTSSVSSNAQPLYIINGKVVPLAVFAAMNPDDLANISVLKDEAATALYGARAANGAIVVTTKTGIVIPTEAEAKNALQGFQIRENFSDYAFWQPRLTTDENGEAYFTAKLPDDITGWQTYVLGLDKKNRAGIAYASTMSYKKLMAELSTPRFAIEGDTFNIIGQSVNYTQDSFDVNTTFRVEDEIIKQSSQKLVSSLADEAEIVVPSEKDSLHFQYDLQTAQYGDGEKRNIPVFRQGVTERVGEFQILKENQTLDFEGVYDTPIDLSIQNSKMDVLLESVEYLKNYQYGCAEQTSSKLIALLLEKDLNKKLGKTFDGDDQIRNNIIRLKDMQNDQGSWGWWRKDDGIAWITLYVIEALQMAEKASFKSKALEDGLDYIAQRNHFANRTHQLKAMSLLIADGTMVDTLLLNKYDTLKLNTSDFLMLNKVRQQLGLQVDLDSITNMMTTTTRGGKYINSHNYWYYNKINNTLLAYDIFKADSNTEMIDAIELYFYSNRSHRGWTNTIHAAQILSRLLPETKAGNMPSKIFVNEKEIKEFPYQIKTDEEKISVRQEGISPYFVNVSQEIFIKNPEGKYDVFKVEHSFLQENKKVEFLEKSVPTELIVDIYAKEEGDYIMIEIPIPAGCSYGKKIQSKWQGIENHREYHKEKIVIFCSHLPQGKNTFEINLEPRYTGKYILNPIKVEEMYAPTIFGRNGVGGVEIK